MVRSSSCVCLASQLRDLSYWFQDNVIDCPLSWGLTGCSAFLDQVGIHKVFMQGMESRMGSMHTHLCKAVAGFSLKSGRVVPHHYTFFDVVKRMLIINKMALMLVAN